MPTNTGWTLDRKINLAAVVAVLAFALSGLSFLFSLDKRTSVLENNSVQQLRIDARQDEAIKSLTINIDQKLTRIDDKFDKVIERINK